jgi:uncharacterized protein with PQ loop repeat
MNRIGKISNWLYIGIASIIVSLVLFPTVINYYSIHDTLLIAPAFFLVLGIASLCLAYTDSIRKKKPRKN